MTQSPLQFLIVMINSGAEFPDAFAYVVDMYMLSTSETNDLMEAYDSQWM